MGLSHRIPIMNTVTRSHLPANSHVAVVGSGVSGLIAAYILSRQHRVTMLDADDRLGGHAHTHRVTIAGEQLDVDSGFIVFNERTYPTLIRVFEELGICSSETEMSLSIRDDELGLEYAGGTGGRGLVPSLRAATPGHLATLAEVPRFHRAAKALLAQSGTTGSDHVDLTTFGEFLTAHRFGERFRRTYAIPLVSAVWSTEPGRALDYPARYLLRFLDHHGMLGVHGSPTWRTVTGGSRTYVEAIAATVHEVRTSSPVQSITESSGGVTLDAGRGPEQFDAVVVATHPAEALAALRTPTAAQRDVLAAITYQPNRMTMHTDPSVMPRTPRARASWNVRTPRRTPQRTTQNNPHGARQAPDNAVTMTYDMTRLQHLPTPHGKRVYVTLGPCDQIDERSVLAKADYAHPLYTPDSVSAIARLGEVHTNRIVFAGAYHGWGFHEDGALSGARAAERLGAQWTR